MQGNMTVGRIEFGPNEKEKERMLHDFPYLQQFHTKYALGPKLPPSCLVCGQQTNPVTRPVAIQHAELPGIVVCTKCRDAALLHNKSF